VLAGGELSVVVSYPFAEELDTDHSYREDIGILGEQSDLILQIPCSYFYMEGYNFQYGTFMICSF